MNQFYFIHNTHSLEHFKEFCELFKSHNINLSLKIQTIIIKKYIKYDLIEGAIKAYQELTSQKEPYEHIIMLIVSYFFGNNNIEMSHQYLNEFKKYKLNPNFIVMNQFLAKLINNK